MHGRDENMLLRKAASDVAAIMSCYSCWCQNLFGGSPCLLTPHTPPRISSLAAQTWRTPTHPTHCRHHTLKDAQSTMQTLHPGLPGSSSTLPHRPRLQIMVMQISPPPPPQFGIIVPIIVKMKNNSNCPFWKLFGGVHCRLNFELMSLCTIIFISVIRQREISRQLIFG